MAVSLRAGSWPVRHPQEQGRQPQNHHHHKPGEEKYLIHDEPVVIDAACGSFRASFGKPPRVASGFI
jgi:hypothetical protein